MGKILCLSALVWCLMLGNLSVAAVNELTVVCDEWPPYQIVDEGGGLSGFSTKVVREVFKRMGVTVKSLKAYPWKRAIYMIETGAADALFSANFSDERTAFAFYPEETLVTSPWVIWSRAEDKVNYRGLTDLKGKKVGVVRGYSYTPEFLETLKTIGTMDESTDDETNFRKLNVGRIDLVAAELGNGSAILKAQKMSQIIPHTDNPIKSDGLYIMFSKSKVPEAFVRQFSDTLKQMKSEAVYQYIYEEYFK
ncbi:transporter substrate-binding domain-containing protein [Desulfatiferula olefinivorans]